MFASFSDPFEAIFAFQHAFDARIASDWTGRGTAAIGSYPPTEVFQKGEDFVAIVEFQGSTRTNISNSPKPACGPFGSEWDHGANKY